MQQKRILLIAMVLFALGLSGLQAQESINTSGNNASGSGGSVSYSVGQTVYQTNSGSNGSVAEGVQQPYEISIITDIGNTNAITLTCNIFPNPTTDFLTLTIDNYNKEDLFFQISDETGKILKSDKITENETKIDLGSFPHAIYFVGILHKHQKIKLFKVIKN